jgi:hypothetical protein
MRKRGRHAEQSERRLGETSERRGLQSGRVQAVCPIQTTFTSLKVRQLREMR